jgi:drug/metabolite transporter (DMT)-like permease
VVRRLHCALASRRPFAMLPRRTLLALVLLTLFWGINWPIMKVSLRELPPLWFRAVSMTGGVLLLFAWYRLRGVSLALPRAQVGRVLLVGVPNVLGWHALSIFGVQALASGRAAILGFTMPIWTALLGVAFFGQPMAARQWIATACAAGAVALLLQHEMGTLAGHPAGTLWMLGAAASWALGTLLLGRVQIGLSTEAMTIWMIGLCLPPLWLLALALEPLPSWQLSPEVWFGLMYGSVVNYGIAQILWFTIARRLPPLASALSVMLIPIIGLGSAMWISGEQPYPQDYGAAALIVTALAFGLLGRRPAERRSAAPSARDRHQS